MAAMIARRSQENVVRLRAFVDPSRVPSLVMIDLQQEYVSAPRLFAIPNAEPALENCLLALAHARAMGMPVAFTRLVRQAPFFNRATRFSHWIDGVDPSPSDMVFERERPSCYASERFAEMMDLAGGGSLVIAGFAGETACLATAIDAYHRGHRVTFLSDASASHGLADIDAAAMHQSVTALIGLYANVVTTKDWIAELAAADAAREGG
jgi:nicotinamidase-related amidase